MDWFLVERRPVAGRPKALYWTHKDHISRTPDAPEKYQGRCRVTEDLRKWEEYELGKPS